MDPRTGDVIKEYSKNLMEYLKYFTTLSTGSIVLEIAFLEKAFPHPKWKGVLALSLLSFTLSIIASVIVYTVIVQESGNPDRKGAFGTGWPANLGIGAALGSWVGFLLGILGLIVFALRNIFAL